MECIVCLTTPAVAQVVINKLDGSVTRYVTCEEHEPRHIPGGDVVSIEVRPLLTGEPGE